MALVHTMLESNRLTVAAPAATLTGRRVLVVEDEQLVAFMIETMLLAHDCGEVWHAATVDDALRLLAQGRPDLALLDVNLGPELVFPVADELVRQQVPLLFATACPRDRMPPRWQQWPVLQKPYDLRLMFAALQPLLAG